MFDLVIRGGTVIDGSGSRGRQVDVGIQDGHIAAIDQLDHADAASQLDANGRVVAPGFIDVHSHSDLIAYLPPGSDAVELASVRQGVTTEVTGNCGWTPFPAPPGNLVEAFRRHLSSVFGPSTRAFPSLAAYRRELGNHGLPVNLAPLVGHGSIRAAVMGLGRATLTDESMRQMVAVLDQALDEGAFGLSSGLVYPPGVYSTPDEIEPLAHAAQRRSKPYTTHIRNETELVLDAIDEGIDIARRTGARVQLSHVKVAGRDQWGTMDALLDRIDTAVGDGLDVRGDAYPYAAGSTLLRAVLPPWVNDGGVGLALDRLRDRDVRQRVERECREGVPGWQNLVMAAGWDGIVIAAATGVPEAQGRSIAELADDAGVAPIDAAADLLLETGGDVVIILHMMAERDVTDALASPHILIGSDTIPVPGSPHPRSAGTFARVLQQAARSPSPDALPDAIRRITSHPAARFGIAGRGRVSEGCVADLVVFDPVHIADRATYDDALAPASGIHHVFLAGEPIIRDAVDTGKRPGRVLEPTS